MKLEYIANIHTFNIYTSGEYANNLILKSIINQSYTGILKSMI